MRKFLAVLIYMALGLFTAGLLATEAGLQWAWAGARAWLPEGLEVGAVQGRLLGPIQLREVAYADASSNVHVQRLEWDWSLLGLFGGRLDITRLEAEDVDYLSRSEDASLPELPDSLGLPFELTLRKASIRAIRYRGHPDDEAILFDELRFRASTGITGLHVNDLELKQGDASLSGSGRIRLRGDYPLKAEFRARWPQSPEQVWQGTLAADGSLRALDFRITLDAPQAATFNGKLQWLKDRLELALEWQALRWPLQGEPVMQSPSGELTLTGTLDAYQYQGQVEIMVPKEILIPLELNGAGDRAGMTVESLAASVGKGSINGHGKVSWQASPSAQFVLEGKDLDPALLDAAWPGQVGFQLQLQAEQHQEHLQLVIDKFQAGGRLRGRDLRAQGRAQLNGDEWLIEQARLRSGASRMDVQGRYGSEADLRATLDCPDLDDLWPDASGQMNGDIKLSGNAQGLRWRGALRGQSIGYAGHSAEKLSMQFDMDAKAGGHSQVELSLQNARLAGVATSSATLAAEGSNAAHATRLMLSTELGTLEAQALGRWAGGAEWQATVESAAIKPRKGASWQLAEPAEARISPLLAGISRSCWTSGESSACLQYDWTEQGTTAAGELRRLPLDVVQPFLPPKIELAGWLDGEGIYEQVAVATTTHARANLKITEGQLRRRLPDGGIATASLLPSHASLLIRDAQLALDATLKPAPAGEIGVVLALPWPLAAETGQTPLKGRISTNLPQLDFVSALLPELRAVRGKLQGDLQLGGTLSAASGTGRLALSEGSTRVERLGLEIEDLTAALHSTGQGGLQLEASGRSGGGELSLRASSRGGLDLSVVDAKVTGREVLVFSGPDARVHVSPNLEVKVRERNIDVSGEIQIPKARITPREFARTGAVAASPDEVLVSDDDASAKEASIWSIRSQVRVMLGEDVHFDGLGLTAELEGELDLLDEPGELTMATGELRVVEGKYIAYGQELSVKSGRLLFGGGPLLEPAVDARAERKPTDDVTVGVQLRGPLDSPRVTLYSDPAMPDSQRLSYLMFGTPLDSGDSARNLAISRAAYALGLGSGEGLLQDIGTRLGADEVKIKASSDESFAGASLVVGKYLTPKLYISYGVGLFDAVRTLRLRYQLATRWTLQTESGTQSGGDLLYTIER